MATTVGAFTYGAQHIQVAFGGQAQLHIGKFCSIATGCTVFLGGNHRTDWITTYPFAHIHQDVFPCQNPGHPATRGDVIIGNAVWIGSRVTIMSGVKIGDGAVIAANSHVVKDVPPYSIVGGNPARVIKYIFPPETIDKLIAYAWWDKSVEEINRIIPILCSPDVDKLFATT